MMSKLKLRISWIWIWSRSWRAVSHSVVSSYAYSKLYDCHSSQGFCITENKQKREEQEEERAARIIKGATDRETNLELRGGGSRLAELFIWALTWTTTIYLLFRLPGMTITTRAAGDKNTLTAAADNNTGVNKTEQRLMGNSFMALWFTKVERNCRNLAGALRSSRDINTWNTFRHLDHKVLLLHKARCPYLQRPHCLL